jgi:uncharacterized protein YkwD
MKKLLVFIMVVCPFVLMAQSWNNDSYLKCNEKNFRNYAPFSKLISAINPDYRLLNAAVFFVTNEARIKHRKRPIPYSSFLESSAFHHSKAMAEQSFFSHVNPNDPTRATTEDRGTLAGISNPAIAENIAMTALWRKSTYLSIAEELVSMWMNSPGHRSNILSDDAKAMGCGVYVRDGRAVLGTQNFQWFYDVVEACGTQKDRLP